MPTVRVETNLAPEFFPEGFMPMFIVAVAELLGKDKKVMKYVFDTNKDMTIVRVINSSFISGHLHIFRGLIMWTTLMATSFGPTFLLLKCSATLTSATP